MNAPGKLLCADCGADCYVDYKVPVMAVNPPIWTYRCSQCGSTRHWSQPRAPAVSSEEGQ